MNWQNAHLYQFNIGAPYSSDVIKQTYANDDFDDFYGSKFNCYDSEKTLISDFFNGQKKKINYTYDFGDDWLHVITPLKKPTEEVLFPKCIKGENAAPIEDCGGIWGFYDLLEILSKPKKNSEEKEIMEWYGIPKGKTYEDIYGFYIDEVNEQLLEVFKQK